MNNNYDVSKKSVVTIRIVAGIISLVFASITVIAILAGFIPIFKQGSNPLTIIYNALEVLSITEKPLFYTLPRIGFSIAYIVISVISIKNLITLFSSMKVWIKEEQDSRAARASISNCVALGNQIFLEFFILLVFSYFLDSYNFGIWGILLLAAIVLGNFASNFMRMYVFKQNFWESFFSPMTTTVAGVALLLFMFNIYDVELDIYLREVSNACRAVFMTDGNLPTGYVLHTILTYFVVPTFRIYVLAVLLFEFGDSVTYGHRYSSFALACRNLMFTIGIASGVIITMYMIAEGGVNPKSFLSLLLEHLEIMLIGVALFFVSKNQSADLADAPTYEDLIKEQEKEVFNPADINLETVQIGEFTFNQNEFE